MSKGERSATDCEGHEEIHDDIGIPRGALIGRDEVSKREIGSEGRSRGDEEEKKAR